MAHWGKRIFISALAGLMAIPAGAAEVVHHTEYKVALGIITIARAAFMTRIEDDKTYRVSGDISSAGLADLVTTISAKTSVDGRLFIFLSQRRDREPRLAPDWFNPEPFFGLDVKYGIPLERSFDNVDVGQRTWSFRLMYLKGIH